MQGFDPASREEPRSEKTEALCFVVAFWSIVSIPTPERGASFFAHVVGLRFRVYRVQSSMEDTRLRSSVIRLAHANPELRPVLLPLLKKADDSEEQEEARAMEILARDLQPLKRGFWNPPHNLALNFALMGANMWMFSILPFMWKKKAYRADLNGIVLHPNWISVDEGRALGVRNMSGFSHLTPEIALVILEEFNKAPLITHTVTRELHFIESNFGISIPGSVAGTIIKDSVKVAKRRWGVDRLRVKDRLIPLDGSPPRDLGSFE